MTTAEQFAQYSMPTYGRFSMVPAKANGTELWDDTGKRYLDFCTGIAVCSVGHCNPRMTKAIQEQAATLLHCSNLYQIPQQGELAQLIVDQCVKIPGKVFFSNSGAESNDGLIKSARRYGHAKPAADGSSRYEILSFRQSFHGRTLGSMFATGQDAVHEGFDPIPQGYRYLPYNDIEALKSSIRPETVAIILEPVQGEGGVHSATPEFLRAVKEVCDENDLLLFFDEVQAGFGRCGEMMAWRAIAPEIEPDGISWAKGMGGGVAIGAFWLNDRSIDDQGTQLSSLMGAKSHGSTYGGNPLACAASLACLHEIIENKLCEAATAQGQRIRDKVSAAKHAAITEVRGKGLLLGFGLDVDKLLNIPEGKPAAGHLCGLLMDAGLLTVPAGTDTLRWLPPLNVTDAEVDEAFEILTATLDSLMG